MFKKEKLADLMKQNNVTHEKLGEEVGVSRQFVSALVKGYKEPSFAVAKRIADYFGVSMDELS